MQFVRKVPKYYPIDLGHCIHIYTALQRAFSSPLPLSLFYYHLLIAFYNEANFLFEVLVLSRHSTWINGDFRPFKNRLREKNGHKLWLTTKFVEVKRFTFRKWRIIKEFSNVFFRFVKKKNEKNYLTQKL